MEKSHIQSISPEEFDRQIPRALLVPIYDISPYIVYLTLKEWFGLPAHIDLLSSRVQWLYYLRTPKVDIEVYDWKRETVSIGIYDRSGLAPEQIKAEADEFLKLIRKQTAKHVGRLKTAERRAIGFIFRNPFQLYFSTAERLLEYALEEHEDKLESHYRLSDYCRGAFFLYIAALEGLLNLIYEIFLVPSLRDERIYMVLRRADIDIKLRLAPLYCTCFKSSLIDSQSEQFERFMSVVNLRNDFVHANITPPMKSPVIEEDGMEFWIFNPGLNKYGTPRSADLLTINDLEFIRQTIWDMAAVIVDAMKPRCRTRFLKVFNHEFIAVEKKGDELTLMVPP